MRASSAAFVSTGSGCINAGALHLRGCRRGPAAPAAACTAHPAAGATDASYSADLNRRNAGMLTRKYIGAQAPLWDPPHGWGHPASNRHGHPGRHAAPGVAPLTGGTARLDRDTRRNLSHLQSLLSPGPRPAQRRQIISAAGKRAKLCGGNSAVGCGEGSERK